MADRYIDKAKRELRRRRHVRRRIHGTAERPRLTVSKSNKATVAQIIDDINGVSIAQVTTAKLPAPAEGPATKQVMARELGKAIAAMAKEKGVTAVVFDRNQYIYHGRVRAVAEGAREGGLQF
ncbi:MAG: 50S ribosomal protein L18 [Candidatus Zixiibacteriota bacterium]